MHPSPDRKLSLALFGCLLLLVSFGSGSASISAALMALTLAGTFAALMRSQSSFPLAQPIFMLCVVYFLAAALPSLAPSLYLHRTWQTISIENLDRATTWMVRGFLALYTTYWFTSYFLVNHRRQASRALPEEAVALRILGLIGVAGFTLTIVSTSAGQSFLSNADREVSSLGQLLHYTTFFNLAYIYSARHRELRFGATLFDRRLLRMALILALALGFFWGSKGAVLSAIVLWFAADVRGGAKSPRLSTSLAWAVFGALGTFYLFAFVAEYRSTMQAISFRYDGDVGAQLQAALTSAATAQSVVAQVPWDAQAMHQLGMILDRLGLVLSFAQLLDISGAISPHENAVETALAPLFSVLPRDVFPTKPIFFNSGSFAYLLGWGYGGYSVTLQGSLFWAWGWSGILFGCSLVGLCLAILQQTSFNTGAWSFVCRLAFAVLFAGSVDVGSTYQFLVIDTIRAGLFAWLILGAARLIPMGRVAMRGQH